MDRTRSQIEELDPLEGSVNRRDIFKKNLQSLESLEAKPSAEMESDEDSGYDVRSTSGQSQAHFSHKILIKMRKVEISL